MGKTSRFNQIERDQGILAAYLRLWERLRTFIDECQGSDSRLLTQHWDRNQSDFEDIYAGLDEGYDDARSGLMPPEGGSDPVIRFLGKDIDIHGLAGDITSGENTLVREVDACIIYVKERIRDLELEKGGIGPGVVHTTSSGVVPGDTGMTSTMEDPGERSIRISLVEELAPGGLPAHVGEHFEEARRCFVAGFYRGAAQMAIISLESHVRTVLEDGKCDLAELLKEFEDMGGLGSHGNIIDLYSDIKASVTRPKRFTFDRNHVFLVLQVVADIISGQVEGRGYRDDQAEGSEDHRGSGKQEATRKRAEPVFEKEDMAKELETLSITVDEPLLFSDDSDK